MLFRLYISHITFNSDFSSYKDWVFRSVVAIVFKVLFARKCIKLMFFYFLKNLF